LGALTGWCWSPDRPAERLRVAFLIDGKRWAGIVAARFDPDLQRDGVCDGYHAFSRSLPPQLDAYSVIEAMELGTGVVFGRLLAPEMEALSAWEERASGIGADIALMHEQCPPDPEKITYKAFCNGLRASAGLLARGIPGGGRGRVALPSKPSRASLPPGLRLPFLSAPQFSFIVDASAGRASALSAMVRLAPALWHFDSEVVVTDDGCGLESAALATLATSNYCLTQSNNPAARAAQAADAAHSPMLVFLGGHDFSFAELDDLLQHAAAEPSLVIGGVLLRVATAAGVASIFPTGRARFRPTGMILITPRDLFTRLGGFAAELHDGEHLPELDFAMRAVAAGERVQVWADPAVPMPEASPPFAARARRLFVDRWMKQNAAV
jgi:hypothetical protein